MKALLTVAALVIGYSLISDSTALSQQQWHPLSHAQRQAYYAGLTAAWVADFCRGHSWGWLQVMISPTLRASRPTLAEGRS